MYDTETARRMKDPIAVESLLRNDVEPENTGDSTTLSDRPSAMIAQYGVQNIASLRYENLAVDILSAA